VLAFAPRIRPELLRTLARLDDPAVPIAEINRRLGREAERRGFRRPSYQRVRVLVHQLRALPRNRAVLGLLRFGVVLRTRPLAARIDGVSQFGIHLPRLRL